jgi:HD-like signal output (HDOD) protein
MTADAFLELHDQIARDLSSGKVIFPTYFNVTLKVRNMLKDPHLSIDQLAKGILLEPLLASRLLQYANTAALRGNAGEVTELKFAILRIGVDAVRAVSFSLAVEQLARSKHMAPFATLSQQLWQHSVTTAAIAQCLATRSRKIRPDEAMFAGLVHDIGAFYLLFRCAEHPMLRQDLDTMLSLVVDWHDSIGHALLAAMEQPEAILDAVRDHESIGVISNDSSTNLREVIVLADRFAHGMASWLPPEEIAKRRLLLNQGIDAVTRHEILESCNDILQELRVTLFNGPSADTSEMGA